MTIFDDIIKAKRAYRQGVVSLLGMGGLGHLIPATEKGWLLFDANQNLRNQGVGKPLPWPDTPPVAWTADEVADAMTRAVVGVASR